jgi:hypothetical protein
MAESLWEPDLPAEDLFETVSQTLLNAVDRDAYSGWGAVVWIIEKVRVLVLVLLMETFSKGDGFRGIVHPGAPACLSADETRKKRRV